MLASDALGGRVARGLAPGKGSAFPERSALLFSPESDMPPIYLSFIIPCIHSAFIQTINLLNAYCMPELCWELEMLL